LRLDLVGFLLGAALRLLHIGLQFVAALAGGGLDLGLGLVNPLTELAEILLGCHPNAFPLARRLGAPGRIRPSLPEGLPRVHDFPRPASASARLHQARTNPSVQWLASPASPSPNPSNATNYPLMAKSWAWLDQDPPEGGRRAPAGRREPGAVTEDSGPARPGKSQVALWRGRGRRDALGAGGPERQSRHSETWRRQAARGQSRVPAGRAQAVIPETLSEAAEPALMAISDTGEKVEDMGSSTRIMRAALLAAAAALLAFAASQLREKHQEAEAAVQDIHDQLDALDPATRAAVVARLTSDEVKRVHDLRQ
jgi:hypothetical protein